MSASAIDADFDIARARLVERLIARGVARSARIIDAFARVPRHLFVTEQHRELAYEDRALPFIDGQTISQPTMIAIMLEALDCALEHRILEIGGGSGYAAALLSALAAEVHIVEIRPLLAEYARNALRRANIFNVFVHVKDGSRGLANYAPFDRVLVSAAAPRVPDALVEQLAPSGRIAIPLNDVQTQVLNVGEKNDDNAVAWRKSVPCLFVPLVYASN